MPVGETQRLIAEAARADGIEFSAQSVDWLNQRGHLGLPDDRVRRSTVAVLEHIYVELGGGLAVLGAARPTRLRGDFIHHGSRTLVEADESQHFTSFRLRTLELYPPDTPLGFDLDEYKELCRKWQRTSDGYFRTKPARGFGIGGRQRQRAYYDALRDLVTPVMGHPPLMRIEAADRDAVDAYRRQRPSIRAALGIGA